MDILIEDGLPVAGLVVGVILLLRFMHWVLIGRNREMHDEGKFARQLVLLGLSALGILMVIFALPISESSRNQLLGLFGVLFSGVFAFASTTIFANLTAGILLRMTRPFRTGEFIQIGDTFGRVSDRGLFDTEIQTEARDLVSLPNLYFIKNPVKTIRASGTIISASLSLGYDVNHKRVEALLIRAAESVELKENFVRIIDLGDFSVTYRVSGLLEDPKFLITTRSRLYGAILDVLHGDGVEIMSPTFMNQRRLSEESSTIPPIEWKTASDGPEEAGIETVAFDKAEQAGELEKEKRRLLAEIEKAQAGLKEAADGQKEEIKATLARAKERLGDIEIERGTIKSEAESAGESLPHKEGS